MRPPRAFGARVAVLATGAALLVGGCSGGDDEPAPDADPTSEGPAPIATRADVAVVAGQLDRRSRQRVERGVVAAVDAWIDGAYLGDFPRRTVGSGFDTFTDDAAARAARQRSLLSNAAVGESLSAVTATRRRVHIDVLAPRGRPAGATARVLLTMDLLGGAEGARARTEVVQGRLTLAPTGGGWRIFGWSLDRSRKRR